MKVSTCKHGTKPTSQTLTCEGQDQFGRKKVITQQIEVLTCEQCKQEVLELLKDVPCKCGEGLMQIRDQAWAQCDHCGYSCDIYQLEMMSKRTEKSQIWHEIQECWRDQLRKGDKGGGSGDKGPKKEDKLGARSVAQMKTIEWTEEESKIVKQNSLEPKGRIRTIRGLPEGITGDQVRLAVQAALLRDPESMLNQVDA